MKRPLIAAWLIALAVPTVGHAQANPCDTPRQAAASFLDNLQEGAENGTEATRCFDWGDTPRAEREPLARKLKAVLDQRGLYIDLEDLPDEREPEEVGDTLVLSSRLPEIELERGARGWRFSRESVESIQGLYDATFSVDIEGFIEALPSWMRSPFLPGLALWQLLGLLLGVVVGLLARRLVANVVVGQGAKLIARSKLIADDNVLKRAGKPFGTLALAGVLWWVLPLLRFSVRVNQVGSIALRVMAAGAVVMVVYRLVDVGADILARRAADTETKLDDQLIPLIRKSLKVFVSAVGIIFVLQNLDVDVGSLIAGASLGGLAFTLAAKDTVANLFGSLSIFADQPFQVGDWVVIEGKEGTVEEVGMRSTRIRTFKESVVSIPNAVVANAAVDNFGQRRYRRCSLKLGLTYASSTDQLQAFVEGIRAILRANAHVRQDAYEVHFRDFGDSALEVVAYFFFTVNTWTEELRERQNVLLEIMRLSEALKVEFAFPTQTLHVLRDGEGKSAAPAAEKLAAIAESFGPGGDRSNADSGSLTSGFWPVKDEE
ncbi:MAG: mechanosensitive ion channel family protein [Myxococcota bacterium]